MDLDGKRAARLEAGVVSPCWSRPWTQGAPSDALEDRQLSPWRASWHHVPCRTWRAESLKFASHLALILWPTSYRPRMQPVAHASDTNPNNGPKYCTKVHQPRVSLPSSSSTPGPPSPSLQLRSSVVGRVDSSRFDSSRVKKGSSSSSSALARACSPPRSSSGHYGHRLPEARPVSVSNLQQPHAGAV